MILYVLERDFVCLVNVPLINRLLGATVGGSLILIINIKGFLRAKHVQEGFARLWRGTYASLALSVPTVSLSCI